MTEVVFRIIVHILTQITNITLGLCLHLGLYKIFLVCLTVFECSAILKTCLNVLLDLSEQYKTR